MEFASLDLGDVNHLSRIFMVHYFEPKMVSLGPYHYGITHAFEHRIYERIKLPYASNFFRSTTGVDVNLVQRIVVPTQNRSAWPAAMNSWRWCFSTACAFMADRVSTGAIARDQRWRSSRGSGHAAPSIVNDMLVSRKLVPSSSPSLSPQCGHGWFASPLIVP